MKLRLFYTIFLFLSLLAASFTPASAEGRLRDILEKRKQEKFAGDDGMFGGLSCERLHKFIEKHKDKIEKRIGEGPVPSLTAFYGKHAEQNLAAYLPVKPTSAPIILMVHGGAWCIGDKAMTKVTLNKVNRWVTKGFIFVSINYRMIPDGANVSMQAEDVADALAYVQKHAKEWGGDTDKIIVMGHSAGAQLAALVAYDGKYLDRIGIDKRRIRGVVSLAGALDFLPLTEPKLEFIFPQSVRAASQPINFISGKEPPSLLLHGESDTRVGIHNSRNLAARIVASGGVVETTYYPEMGHVGILLALAAPLRDGKPVLDRVAKFIDERAAAR